MVFGGILGGVGDATTIGQLSDSMRIWANVDPHALLYLFLPLLVFESSFSVDCASVDDCDPARCSVVAVWWRWECRWWWRVLLRLTHATSWLVCVSAVHVFKRLVGHAITLAIPGLMVSTALTALVAKFVLPYDWDANQAILMGTVLSATDPVAVVALLKELSVSEQLATLIEGESLLNDGTGMLIYPHHVCGLLLLLLL